MTNTSVENAKIVSRTDWLAARQALLAEEKALTKARDALNEKRRQLPWVRMEKEYRFDTPEGEQTLAGLFQDRSELIVYHFMWRSDLDDACVGCSFLADHVDGANLHLAQHDVSFVAVSRAPLEKIEAFRKKMDWKFRWVSSLRSDFNYDFHVSFRPEEIASGKVYYNYGYIDASIEELSGISVFYRNDRGEIFHTYSSYGRGNEEVLGAYMYLDLTPKGRNETGPNYNLTDWVRHHDRYHVPGHVDRTGAFQPEKHSCCAPLNAAST